jgi:hypothetical protein
MKLKLQFPSCTVRISHAQWLPGAIVWDNEENNHSAAGTFMAGKHIPEFQK